MRRTLWDLFWKISHNIRCIPCVLMKRHIGKSWFGIQTINKEGEGFCSVCGTGALTKPHYTVKN